MKPIPDSILNPLISHPVWALLMWTSPLALHTMGIDSAYQFVRGHELPAVAFMTLASAGAWLSHHERFHGRGSGLAMILPQQLLMLWSLWTITTCILGINTNPIDYIARYPNGYAPPEGWRFIGADQVWFAIGGLQHTRRIWRTYVLNKE